MLRRTGTPSLRASLSVILLFVVAALHSPATLAEKKSKKKQALMQRGAPVLWREPGDIRARNLLTGPGGAAMRPVLRKVTFIEQEGGGYSLKYRVRDGAGREWVAKVGKEAQSETAAVRLVWAAGYMTEINYLAPCVRIVGAPAPPAEVERCRDGSFANVRFEARPKQVKRLGEWKWDENPFAGTRQLQGLKTLMALLNNWDLKDSNNALLYVPDGGRGQLQYVISDLGATFGKTGSLPLFWRITRSRNNPEDYSETKFIDGVRDGLVDFRYGGKNRGLLKDIRVSEARWIGQLLSRLSDRQIADAFRAANYTPSERRLLTEAVRARINQLASLRSQPRSNRAAAR